MAFEINLLTKKEGISQTARKLSRFMQILSIVFVIPFILGSIVIIGVRIFLALEASQRASQIKELTQKIEDAKETESTYVAFVQKISTLDTLVSNRFFPSDMIRRIDSIIPIEAQISNLSLSPDDQNFILTVKSQDPEKIEETVEKLLTFNSPQLYEIILNALSLDQSTKEYTGQISVGLKINTSTESASLE